MGIYVGGESEQPHNPTQYAWSQIKGNDSGAGVTKPETFNLSNT